MWTALTKKTIWLERSPSESKAKDALEQIMARDYLHGLRGRTLLYGIAFRNKKATVLSEELHL